MMPGNELQNVPGGYIEAFHDLTLTHILKQAGSGTSSAIGSILVSVFVSVLQSI